MTAQPGNIYGSADKSLQLGIPSNKTCPGTDILPGDVAITDKREYKKKKRAREKSSRSTEAGQSRCASYISNFSDGRVHTGGILPIWRATVLSGSAGRNSAYGGTDRIFASHVYRGQLLR